MKEIIPLLISFIFIIGCEKDKNIQCDYSQIIAGSNTNNCFDIINVFDTITGYSMTFDPCLIYYTNDSTPDFYLGCSSAWPTEYGFYSEINNETGITVLNPAFCFCMEKDSTFVKLFDEGESINSNNIWRNNYPIFISRYILRDNKYLDEEINVNLKNKYIGFRYIDDADTIYNWLKISTSVKSDMLYIQNYAMK